MPPGEASRTIEKIAINGSWMDAAGTFPSSSRRRGLLNTVRAVARQGDHRGPARCDGRLVNSLLHDGAALHGNGASAKATSGADPLILWKIGIRRPGQMSQATMGTGR